MLVSQIMKKNFFAIPPSASIQEAAQKMKEKRVGMVLVFDHDHVEGIVTTVVLAALIAASEVTRKPLDRLRIVLFGIGAANVATYRLLIAYGLDPKSIRILRDVFKEYVRRGHTILMSTHTLDAAEALCDRIAIIDYDTDFRR